MADDEPFLLPVVVDDTHRFRDNAMFADRTVPAADVIASAERTAAGFPNDPFVHYELARRYRDLSRCRTRCSPAFGRIPGRRGRVPLTFH